MAAQNIPIAGVSETQSRAGEAWGKILRQPLSLVSLVVVVIYVLVGLASFAPFMESKIETPVAGQKTFAPPAFSRPAPDGTREISPARWCGLDFEGPERAVASVLWNADRAADHDLHQRHQHFHRNRSGIAGGVFRRMGGRFDHLALFHGQQRSMVAAGDRDGVCDSESAVGEFKYAAGAALR